VQPGPTAGLGQQHGRGYNADDGDQRADGHIHIGDGRHAGHGRGDNDEDGDDPGALLRRQSVGKDEVQHIAAALELIAGDGHVGEEDGDGAEHAGGLVVARLEKVG
jgi:hypothetical protein